MGGGRGGEAITGMGVSANKHGSASLTISLYGCEGGGGLLPRAIVASCNNYGERPLQNGLLRMPFLGSCFSVADPSPWKRPRLQENENKNDDTAVIILVVTVRFTLSSLPIHFERILI